MPPGYPAGQLDEGVVGAAARLGAPTPAEDLLAFDTQGFGEGVPGEAARLLQPFEPLREVLGQLAARVGHGTAGDHRSAAVKRKPGRTPTVRLAWTRR